MPNRSQCTPRVANKLYNLLDKISAMLKVPSIDQPVVALPSAVVLPSEGEGGPKDPGDRRVEGALKKNFDVSALVLKASVANSVMARGILAWVEDLVKADCKSDRKLSSATCNTLKKIFLAAAFTADSVQYSAKALAVNVVARRNIWLCQWEVDQGSQSQLVSEPFMGSKLFGESTESSDKRKVLPSARKEQSRGRGFSLFSFPQIG